MRRNPFRRSPLVSCLGLITAAWLAGPAAAQQSAEGPWTVRIDPMFVEATGHDQHVLDIGGGSTGQGVDVTVDSGPGYHLEIRRGEGRRWGWGVDFFWFSSPQSVADQSAAAGSPDAPVSYSFPGGAYISTGPDETLYYRLLEDNDIAAWTADFYAIKPLREAANRRLQLLFGLRTADFDNDYRAVVGIAGAAGTRFDSSSNYERMHGPMVGLVASSRRGVGILEGYVGQAVVIGTTQLSSTQSDFVGPFVGEAQEFVEVREFSKPEDVTIPITELRGRWSRPLGRTVSLTAGVAVAAWWNLSVPPGVEPTPAGLSGLRENTIVFYGLFVGLELR